MPTTSRFGVVTDSGSTPNDFALAMFNIAEDITAVMAGAAQGLDASRPAAGELGRFWYSTDSTVNGGLFYDNGTVWIRVTASPWVNWTPSVVMTDGGGGVISGVNYFPSSTVAQYRSHPGSMIEVYISETVRLQGTQKFVGLLYSSPVACVRTAVLQARAMDDVASSFISDTGGAFGNVIAVFPHGGYNARAAQLSPGSYNIGQWLTDNAPRGVNINGLYSV